MLDATYDEATRSLSLKLSGRMGTRESDRLPELLASRLSEIFGPEWNREEAEIEVVLDMTSVDYICSGFMRFCVGTAKRMKKSGLKVVNCQEMVKQTFTGAGLDVFLSVE